MNSNTHLNTRRRARTDSQKEDRRRAILEAASTHFEEVGFESFSMSVLARAAGVAKGTLYLYFTTREEVLLALYMEQLCNWGERLRARLTEGMEDAEFVQCFLETSREDPALMLLGARMESVIEHNISLEALVNAKRGIRNEVQRLAPELERCLGLSSAATYDLLGSLKALQTGAVQAHSGPVLEQEPLPDDVREFIDMLSMEDVFTRNALRILRGIRAETA
jgi:AcrR family transcriptional regulator